MQEQKNLFNSARVYACRCPSCKRLMNVPGITLNNEKYIECWNCKARSRSERWVEGAPRWAMLKS